MSQENVEVVREMWAAYADNDPSAGSEYYADDAVSEDIPELPDGETYVGPAGVVARYWHFVRTWGDFTIEPVEFIDAGGTSVVVTAAMAGRAAGSDLPLNAEVSLVYEIGDGKIVRDRVFLGKSDALKAVGLKE